jgi:hypothetical protein
MELQTASNGLYVIITVFLFFINFEIGQQFINSHSLLSHRHAQTQLSKLKYDGCKGKAFPEHKNQIRQSRAKPPVALPMETAQNIT